MRRIESALKNQVFSLEELEKKLKPLGFDIGGGWEYDHGFFDYQLQQEKTYFFLRIPFTAEIGQLDEQGVQVRIGQPFVLGHQFQTGIDEEGQTGNFSASLNQFQDPVDQDTSVPERFMEKGQQVLEAAEQALLS
ncbi:MAG: hypothetical protein H0Z32_09700 [Bacillaceae bacterium]|nr:hypothetical protein [Bacillaceae bacterium]